jgi:hypothetical protein|tara:strand:+ start:97 stop:210 length:114 start_codon:yes stop_codon:yes gene_type:complete
MLNLDFFFCRDDCMKYPDAQAPASGSPALMVENAATA